MTNSRLFSTPALVVALGRSLLPSVAETERIFLRSDSRRAATTRFIALQFHARKAETDWSPLPPASAIPDLASGSWKQFLARTQAALEPLKTGLRTALHELRAHGRLMEAGLGDQAHLPLDVFLVADLSEGEASALLVLTPLLQALLADDPYARLHLLLDLATFSEDPLLGANQFITLQGLVEMLEGRGSFGNLASARPQIYLFDRFKEGTWEAQDAHEVHTILGNFLLALLLGGLAQRLAHAVPMLEVDEQRSYFSSAAAVSLILDTERLRRECARRLAAELTAAEFDARIVPDPGAIDAAAADFIVAHTNARVWREALCRETTYHPLSDGRRLEIHISDLCFEGLPMTDWRKVIESYDREFQEKRWPIQSGLLRQHHPQVRDDYLDDLCAFADALPQLPRLYPGGVCAARGVLAQIRKAIQESHGEPPELFSEQAWRERIESSLVGLERALANLPQPPRWLQRLPDPLKRPLVQLFHLVFLRRELRALVEMRQASVRLLEQKYAAQMEALLSQTILDLCTVWMAALDQQDRRLGRLQKILSAVQRQFSGPANEALGRPSPFRLAAADDSVLAWAYYQGRRPTEGFRQALLGGHACLQGWQKTTVKKLAGNILSFCENVHRPLEELDLERVLQHRAEKGPGALANALRQGTIPLLRPNFDQIGSGATFQLRFFLAGAPQSSSIYSRMQGDLQDWQALEIGDASLALCCRVRLLIPHASLEPLFERGRAAYEALDQRQREECFP